MTTNGEAIKHLWTHKTQDHPWLADEELVIDRAEGVWVWTERGHKLLDGFDGKLTSTKWAKIAKCSQDTAQRDIQALIDLRILVRDAGGGRSTSYSLAT